jgi:hypothetical protein
MSSRQLPPSMSFNHGRVSEGAVETTPSSLTISTTWPGFCKVVVKMFPPWLPLLLSSDHSYGAPVRSVISADSCPAPIGSPSTGSSPSSSSLASWTLSK